MRGSWRASLCLSLALRHAHASPVETPDSKLERRADGDLCYLNSQKIAMIDDRLYFMGGDYHFDGDANAKTFTNDNLFYFDLSGNTSIPADSIIPASALTQLPIPLSATPTLANQTHSRGGALFTAADAFYVFAGLDGDDVSSADSSSLAKFNTTSSTWSRATVSGGPFNRLTRTSAGAVSAPDTGLSFFSGGTNAGVGKPGQPTGMLRFDARDPDALTWRNETAVTSSSGVGVPARVGGNMVFVPMGEQGVVLVWGGYNGTEVNATTGAPAYSYQLLDSERIWVYDVASASCFRWIKMSSSNYTGSNTEALSGNNRGRHLHKCAVHNDAQMIVLGGIVNENGTESDHVCDSQLAPLRILNLATMTWQKSFDASARYTVPEDVSRVIGGDGSGGATIRQPDGGFNDTAVASIFAKTVSRAVSTATSSAAASSTNSSSSDPASSNTGAIVGGVVGGVVGLALICLIVWLVMRKKRSAAKGQMVPQMDEGAYGHPADVYGSGNGGYVHGQQAAKTAELDDGAELNEADGRMKAGEMDGRGVAVAPVEMEGDRPKVGELSAR
ncbi:Galactose oxidase/kelch beta-propeller [Macrophomina phaseolina MS6]|uniref:Galactose oxidase/kelch beta-propeller n=1 Tax=Macrophomina phaseolina (strain MS6) TaxID=1126212 RepID=K2RJB6_MACPH|nr:Galactose oxidase/kelch beta-propeller [Macrophomina phaseolina MS6]